MYVSMYVCMYVCMFVCMFVCLYVCMFVCLYVCMYVRTYVRTHVCMCVCMYVCMHVCMYVCMHACMYVCMYACMHACMHACMYVCMYLLYIYIYDPDVRRVGLVNLLARPPLLVMLGDDLFVESHAEGRPRLPRLRPLHGDPGAASSVLVHVIGCGRRGGRVHDGQWARSPWLSVSPNSVTRLPTVRIEESGI